ncbi:MAG TPA: protein-L-isoaspartate O-methyltransferase [Puia sp.]|nr:protein-L-isoaspartate O-methyltransferase [Puia sp.]
MEIIRKLQEQLLAQAPFLQKDNEYHNAIKEAFRQTPRHLFVNKFREYPHPDWTVVTEENLPALLPILYANKPLSLYDEPGSEFTSTISQPYIVLKMLDFLEVGKGNTIFEIGAASGWTAALLGALVGDEGHVYSTEIIPELALQAKENIERSAIPNVTILPGDGGFGYEPGAPFDRVVFAASSYDLPSCFYDQLKEGGLLLIVLKRRGGGDLLIQLKKTDDHFEAIKFYQCGFVKMTGKYEVTGVLPILLEQMPEWQELQNQELVRSPFWWGGPSDIPLNWRTSSFRFFLGLTAPGLRIFSDEKNPAEFGSFGLLHSDKKSFTLAKDHLLITYGTEDSRLAFMNYLYAWIDLGMPGTTQYNLKIYPIEKKIDPPAVSDLSGSAGVTGKQWIVKRADSQFVWSLD